MILVYGHTSSAKLILVRLWKMQVAELADAFERIISIVNVEIQSNHSLSSSWLINDFVAD